MNHPLRKRYRSTRLGVTLVEAIMVIMLLSAAAASSMIYFDGSFVSRGEVSSSTHQVADTLQLAHNTAVLNQTKVSVRQVRGRSNQQLLITQAAGPIRDERTWLVDLPVDVKVSGSPTEITFTPLGQADQRLGWTISQGDSQGAVSVSPVAGTITRKTP
ncbi:hypothetical protein N9N28_17140 [Rubripirellula amarantea]|uniref:General secretion pathway GspH domain-containing protein n=1 Tax=Rubripirellula amarantea TaxID=2527999 RepID=A0A5C5WRF1_9BACT|nr:hypothetical protein [Rubripirellula amarantea]MDA8746350.1 hypothetical protein [Rubripirellula amarantea]TWT52825.1 hypothetical protein Pla22_04530 [Rubripirellula amarantea]